MTQPRLDDRNLLFTDVETTGLNPSLHEIIEVAAILTTPDARTVLRVYEAKIQPLHIEDAEPKALAVNGYKAEDWTLETCTPRQRVIDTIHEMYQGAMLVGHNIAFDESFLVPFARENDIKTALPWHYHKICTQTLSWPLKVQGLIENVRLETLCKYLGVSKQQKHRAMQDTEDCRLAYIALMELYSRLHK